MNYLTPENLNIISTAVITPLILVVGKYIITFFDIKTKQLKENVKNEKMKKYLEKAEDAVETAVIAITQTYVEAFKKGNLFTEVEQTKAFNDAKSKAIAIMGEKTMAALKEELSSGEIELWIDAKIDKYVQVTKKA